MPQQGGVWPDFQSDKMKMFWFTEDGRGVKRPIRVEIFDIAIGMDGKLRLIFRQTKQTRDVFLERQCLELNFCDDSGKLKGPFECELCLDINESIGLVMAHVGQVFSETGEPTPVSLEPADIAIACK